MADPKLAAGRPELSLGLVDIIRSEVNSLVSPDFFFVYFPAQTEIGLHQSRHGNTERKLIPKLMDNGLLIERDHTGTFSLWNFSRSWSVDEARDGDLSLGQKIALDDEVRKAKAPPRFFWLRQFLRVCGVLTDGTGKVWLRQADVTSDGKAMWEKVKRVMFMSCRHSSTCIQSSLYPVGMAVIQDRREAAWGRASLDDVVDQIAAEFFRIPTLDNK